MTVSLLVVEDEVLIAFTLEDALTEAGYDCVLVHKGQDALDHLNRNAARFQGVLTDIRLGQGPDGWDVADRARQLVPDMPVLYASADGMVDWPSKGVPNSVMIPKPYADALVITAIASMINDTAERPHSSLGCDTPAAPAVELEKQRAGLNQSAALPAPMSDDNGRSAVDAG